jgi:glucosamine-6-phosphate deaminase
MKNDISKLSKVEKAFLAESVLKECTTEIPYVVVGDFPKLGLFTALRFLEWVSENPEGVISLPTGKTPEFFIKWTKYLLKNWDEKQVVAIREKYGLKDVKQPVLSGLHFVQIDEFYPIASSQHNSFYNYVVNFYLENLGLDKNKALLINCDEIPLAEGKNFEEVFPGGKVDLSLRYKESSTLEEKLQQASIFMIDQWCSEYEQKIRDKGGIGFFLGGIGPDGHIAFNVRGSDMYSTTRLTETNFETQAVAAGDLGGIEVSANRLVITIGLETITFNPQVTAIIIAAGEAKAQVVKESLEQPMTNIHPASVLAKSINSRFYLTEGAATKLDDYVDYSYKNGEWTPAKSEKAIINLCKEINKYGHRLLLEDLKKDKYCKMIPALSDKTPETVVRSIIEKIDKGLRVEKNQRFLFTGPHHDDILLGVLPFISHHIQEESNKFNFAVLTSGFNAVTNAFVIKCLRDTKVLLDKEDVHMVKYADFFESGYKYKWDKDVYHYVTSLAANDKYQMNRGVCHRVIRALTETYKVKDESDLRDKINEVLTILKNSYDGEKNPPAVQKIKGMIREFEEELVWAHFGVPVKDITHSRLGFYKGDIFTEQPEKGRDVAPILEMIKKVDPTVISLAFDPEGSGPDTHYKVLQAIAEALRELQKEKDLSEIRVWGYRNVWFKFTPDEANVIVPVSLGEMAMNDKIFENCYLSQVDASFPSFELNGKFSSLSQRIWVDQLKTVQLLLGKDYFYQNKNPKLRSAHGLIFVKEMTVEEFLGYARELEKSTEGEIKLD